MEQIEFWDKITFGKFWILMFLHFGTISTKNLQQIWNLGQFELSKLTDNLNFRTFFGRLIMFWTKIKLWPEPQNVFLKATKGQVTYFPATLEIGFIERTVTKARTKWAINQGLPISRAVIRPTVELIKKEPAIIVTTKVPSRQTMDTPTNNLRVEDRGSWSPWPPGALRKTSSYGTECSVKAISFSVATSDKEGGLLFTNMSIIRFILWIFAILNWL